MAYDEDLASRIRELIADTEGVLTTHQLQILGRARRRVCALASAEAVRHVGYLPRRSITSARSTFMAIRLLKPDQAVLLTAAIAAVAALPGAPAAQADCGLGPPFALVLGKSPRLLPTLHATETLDCGDGDGREYDYSVKGYFKVAGTTVARLPRVTGHADATREHITLTVKRSTRRTIRAAATRRGAHRTTLTLVYRVTQTNTISGDLAPRTQTYAQDSFLTIPRK